ncbi:MAG: hypothetical protein JNK78_13165 [Planctomycetes bacterium]|nr:hypothetical protein [Planctomycetota bacterium]
MSSTIAIHYQLYTTEATDGSTAPKLDPVESEKDLELQAVIRAADTSRRVTSVGTVAAQNRVLSEHVEAVPFDLPIFDYLIRLDDPKESLWDREERKWIRVETGGAIYYAVEKEDDAGRLFLGVWTEGATGARGGTEAIA